MNPHRDVNQLGARIKLLKRHMEEWKELLLYQQQARQAAQQHIQQQKQSRYESKLNSIRQVTLQAYRVIQLHARQAEERKAMSVRHAQEEADLEVVINELSGKG